MAGVTGSVTSVTRSPGCHPACQANKVSAPPQPWGLGSYRQKQRADRRQEGLGLPRLSRQSGLRRGVSCFQPPRLHVPSGSPSREAGRTPKMSCC